MALIKSSVPIITQHVRNSFRLKGIYPSVVTPFAPPQLWNTKISDSDKNKTEINIDFARFERMLIHLKRYPVAGFAVLGSAGEFASIDFNKKLSVVAHARKYLGEHPTIIAGAGLESTADTIDLVNRMAVAGADACFVYNPSYFREHYDNSAYLGHFEAIADRSPIPIIMYNIPSHIDRDIPVDVVCDLAKHPNVVGLLDTSGNIARIATVCKRTRDIKHFDVMAGSAGFFLPALLAGCSGAVCSLANVLPFELHNLQDLFEEGKFEKARKLQWRLMEPNEAITTRYGVPGLKAILKACVDIDAGLVRPPLRDLNEQETAECLKIFHQNGFLLPKKKLAADEHYEHHF